ncbi:MAG: response regulator transcription factor [bacterium]|nr:response regulator transcription factor [bacterium]
MRLLVVEDEAHLARYLVRGLREDAYAVDHVATYAEASERAFEHDYDLAILDLMLPDGTGLDLLREWRAGDLRMPVLVLTARDTLEDKVTGLDLGADDYLTKPFEFDELLARVRSLLRRQPALASPVLKFEELELDSAQRRVSIEGRAVELTVKEFALLEYLMQNPRRVLSRGRIAEHAWDDSYTAETNVIDVFVGRLRRKIREAGGRNLIQTVKGLGYVLREPESP